MISFRGKYWFLSNFYPAELEFKGLKYSTAEHAFQAAKAVSVFDEEWIRTARKPGEAKRRGRKVHVWADWERVKLNVMLAIAKAKFQNKELAEKLLATGDNELVEHNTWGDAFWGKCGEKGENHLGKILMQVRQELRDDNS